MIYFKLYYKLRKLCKLYNIEKFNILKDGRIDVFQDVDISNRKLKEFPIKIRNVEGAFSCANNELTSLIGAPEHISDLFLCQYNNLTKIDYLPEVGLNIQLNNNQLITLEGMPEKINASLFVNNNNLTNLKGGPKQIGAEHFYFCQHNKLTSLEGCSEIVGSLYCQYNKLTNLKKGPEKVNSLICNHNQLTSLEGIPKEINYLDASNNNLTSLKELNGTKIKEIRANLNNITTLKNCPIVERYELNDNPINEILQIISDHKTVGMDRSSENYLITKKLIEDYDFIINNNQIILSRFKDALEEIGIVKIPTEIKGYIYV